MSSGIFLGSCPSLGTNGRCQVLYITGLLFSPCHHPQFNVLSVSFFANVLLSQQPTLFFRTKEQAFQPSSVHTVQSSHKTPLSPCGTCPAHTVPLLRGTPRLPSPTYQSPTIHPTPPSTVQYHGTYSVITYQFPCNPTYATVSSRWGPQHRHLTWDWP